MSTNLRQVYVHPAGLIIVLAITPAIGLRRFAYALVLPVMRESLGWHGRRT